MTTTETARKLYKVLGTTDEVTNCEHCGRDELKGTIILGVLDEDGNVEDRTYFGAVCGAKAAGWTTKDIRKAATAADRAAREAAYAARQAQYAQDAAANALLRFTADCPLGPSICRTYNRPCPAHS